MTNKGPEWQAVFGPISTTELIKGTYYHLYPDLIWSNSISIPIFRATFHDIPKGKFKLASQIVKVGDNGMHVFVNDWDINNWNMFMYVGNWQPKLRGHHFKGNVYFVQGSTAFLILSVVQHILNVDFWSKNREFNFLFSKKYRPSPRWTYESLQWSKCTSTRIRIQSWKIYE